MSASVAETGVLDERVRGRVMTNVTAATSTAIEIQKSIVTRSSA
jgi:hypothetical protein